jgi:hypothetical protein
VLVILGCHSVVNAADLKDGDIVFHTSRSAQSQAIQRATGSKYSHMGLVLIRDGKPYVFEAVATARYTPLDQWARRGLDGRYVVKRVKSSVRSLTPADLDRLRRAAKDFEGKPYDLTFEWSDSRIYCSELVWKIYDRALGLKLGRLQKLGEFNLKDPAVKAKLQERYGRAIPVDETVISPSAMFQSDALEEVAAR